MHIIKLQVYIKFTSTQPYWVDQQVEPNYFAFLGDKYTGFLKGCLCWNIKKHTNFLKTTSGSGSL